MAKQITPEEFIQRIATRTGLQPGWIDDARRAATPHAAEWLGLTREDLGDADLRRSSGKRVTGARSDAQLIMRSNRSGTRAGSW
ncbi:MAG: hypothetical protein ACJ8DV_10890, partial [Microvirga sp.]